MYEELQNVPEFPKYLVSRDGEIFNELTLLPLLPSVNTRNIVSVVLFKNGKPHRRAIAPIVLDAFVPEHRRRDYNTCHIHLNGNKTDCHSENLARRPRWFAVKYHQQFIDPSLEAWCLMPVVMEETGEKFDRAIDCCMKYGLLVSNVVMAAVNPGDVEIESMSTFRVYQT